MLYIANMLSAVLFTLLSIFYIVQLVISWRRGNQPLVVPRPNGSEGTTSVRSALPHFDGGLQNTIWAFLILGIFLPVVLASMGHVLPYLRKDDPFAIMYFICVAVITVIITLEFSYVHNLRNSAPEWTPFLLVGLVLDFTALLVFTLVVGHPNDWTDKPMSELLILAMLVTTVIAVLSSFVVLVLARTAGALHTGQIGFPDDLAADAPPGLTTSITDQSDGVSSATTDHDDT